MRWWHLRVVLNLVNLTTPLGLLVGLLGNCRFRRLPRGLVLASGYPFALPAAAAFTIGNVVLTRHAPERLLARPGLLAHEERHTSQYAVLLGLPLLPLYLLGAGWSWLATGSIAAHNPFERWAGLASGGYPTVSPRPLWRRWSRPRRR
jgi:hypothetical protein